MNILLIGEKYNCISSIIRNSKLLDKRYVASNDNIQDITSVKHLNINELAQKACALQIDIAINTDNNLINSNIIEIFKKNKINLISINKKWLNLETSRMAAKQLMLHYSVNVPQTVKMPTQFPVVIRTDSEQSMKELVEKLQEKRSKGVYIEDYLDGETFYLNTMWDGKNIFYFNMPDSLNEVQQERLDFFKTKFNFILSDENADFTGIFTISLIWTKNDWYINDFYMGINNTMNSNNLSSDKDFLYILNAAIYQKLNEI